MTLTVLMPLKMPFNACVVKIILNQGDLVLVTQGDKMGQIGSTNTCRILKVE